MLTQIYEISSPEEAVAVSAIGIDHVGVLVGDGRFPREQPMAAAATIAAAIGMRASFTALFLTHDVSLIIAWARELRPSIIHLGASPELLSPMQVAVIKRELPRSVVMRSVPVTGEESLDVARSYEGMADYLLLDSYRPSDRQVGALGVTHDWNISRRIVELVRMPVVLAGAWGRTMSEMRYARCVPPALIRRPRRTGTARTRRILGWCGDFGRLLWRSQNGGRGRRCKPR